MNQENKNQGGQIILQQRGGLGIITLNRSEALNALSLEMIRQIAMALKDWELDPSVAAVMFLGAGDRAFCAGGDVKSFHSSGMDYRRGEVDISVPSLYFAEEYSLNQQIFNYPKSTIAIMDGIVMGGGYGIAGHCQHRVVTQNAVFAMPEVGIGFFPDVGSVYHLLHAPHCFGRYLALTGVSIGAGDILAAGLADSYIDAGAVDALIAAFSGDGADEQSEGFYGDNPKPDVFAAYKNTIERVFATFDVDEICGNLEGEGSSWASETLALIQSRAPLSVLVTAKHLENLVDAEFDDVIAADFILAQNFIAYPDLYEGIRAALIDKDKAPAWEPARIEDVKAEDIARYFKPSARQLSDVQIFS